MGANNTRVKHELLVAEKTGNHELLRSLCDRHHDALPAYRTDQQGTVFHEMAAVCSDAAAVKILLHKVNMAVDINALDNNGHQAADIAAQKKKPEVERALRKYAKKMAAKRMRLQRLENAIIGQRFPVKMMTQSLQRIELQEDDDPAGLLLLLGGRGLGKTELARQAQRYFRSDPEVCANVHEFSECCSRLEFAGHIRSVLRREPTSVVRLDYVDTMPADHRAVLRDIVDNKTVPRIGESHLSNMQAPVKCNRALFVITSGVGADLIDQFFDGQLDDATIKEDYEKFFTEKLRPLLEQDDNFGPSLVAKIDHIVCFKRFTDQEITELFVQKLTAWEQHFRRGSNCQIFWQQVVPKFVSNFDPKIGGHSVANLIAKSLQPQVRRHLAENFGLPVPAGVVIEIAFDSGGEMIFVEREGERVEQLEPEEVITERKLKEKCAQWWRHFNDAFVNIDILKVGNQMVRPLDIMRPI